MRRKAASTVEGAGYSMHYDQGVYTVTYRRSTPRPALRYALLLVLLGLVTAVLFSGTSPLWLLPPVFLFGVIALLPLVPSNGTFHFTRYLFSVGGRRYNRQRIHALYLQLPRQKAVFQSIPASIPPFSTAAAPPVPDWAGGLPPNCTMPAAAEGLGGWRQLLQRAYHGRQASLGFVQEGRQVPLATGMSAELAAQLFRRLKELAREG